MKVNANTLRAGHVVDKDGKLFVVLKSQIITPGKGASVVQVDMRGIKDGVKTSERFRTQETVERAQLEDRDFTFLYPEGEAMFVFMDVETYEQIHVGKDVVGEGHDFLQDGMPVTLRLFEGQAVSCELPQTVTLDVVEADRAMKGQTAASSYKPAKLSNGRRVMVPPFIEIGDKVVVKTEDASYLERAK
ncbi:MAG: elongation factor P [Alphaproteobacteria bacterium]|nr:elongation factor P [Alphaproteobacteria bacterium]